jgi:CSLREA domain-containing protein
MKHRTKLLGKGFHVGARGLLAAALAVSALGLAAAPASAATIVVNTTTDQALGSCSGSCSLRDAVATANSGDTVQVPAGHYVLTLGDIISGKSLTIVGGGARTTILDGNGASRIFQLLTAAQGQALINAANAVRADIGC